MLYQLKPEVDLRLAREACADRYSHVFHDGIRLEEAEAISPETANVVQRWETFPLHLIYSIRRCVPQEYCDKADNPKLTGLQHVVRLILVSKLGLVL